MARDGNREEKQERRGPMKGKDRREGKRCGEERRIKKGIVGKKKGRAGESAETEEVTPGKEKRRNVLRVDETGGESASGGQKRRNEETR